MYEIVEHGDVFVVLAHGGPQLSFLTVEDALSSLQSLVIQRELIKCRQYASRSYRLFKMRPHRHDGGM